MYDTGFPCGSQTAKELPATLSSIISARALPEVPHFQPDLHGLSQHELLLQWHQPGAQAIDCRPPLFLLGGGCWIGRNRARCRPKRRRGGKTNCGCNFRPFHCSPFTCEDLDNVELFVDLSTCDEGHRRPSTYLYHTTVRGGFVKRTVEWRGAKGTSVIPKGLSRTA